MSTLSITVLILLAQVLVISVSKDLQCPKPFCRCYNRMRYAICSGISVTYIPKLPHTIIVVTIRNTSLGYIKKNGFSNLTSITKRINLSENGLQYIHEEALVNFRYLSVIEISNEPQINISLIKDALARLTSDRFEKMIFKFNNWFQIPFDFFSIFQNNKILAIKLNNNNLRHIDMTIFQQLKGLRYLDLSSNIIKDIMFSNLSSLSKLNLNNNMLSEMPSFCQKDNASCFPNLRFLHLNINFIGELTIHTFDCLPKLERLYLDNSIIKVLKDNIFSVLPSLKQLSIGNSGTHLKRIENFAFNSSSLETLSLANSKFHFDKPHEWYNPEFIFSLCRNLKHLNLDNNYLPKNQNTLQNIFRPLEKIQKLTLQSTKFVEMPKYVFNRMPLLKHLNLRDNGIGQWNDSMKIFGNISSLRYLILSLNNIHVINEALIGKNIMSSLEKLDLAKNPFACTCDQKWFRNWIRTTHIKMIGYPRNYICRQPTHLNGVLLDDFNPTEDICRPWNHLYTLAITLPLVLIFVAILAALFFQCQTNIKNYIYLMRVLSMEKKSGDLFDAVDNYDYHAFVVYCDADRIWVHGELLRRIETEMKLKLCIHQRDFRVGENVIGNIDNFLNKSWKILVIMSNDFAKSEWCQWEVDVVQERRRRIGENAVIPIMYRNIDSKHMTSQIRMLIYSTPYISFQSGVGEKLFWKTLEKALKRPFGHRPISVI